jgi:DNA-binding winged helix-turn-helix (wHTH) protein
MADWIGVTFARLSTARPGRKGAVRREDPPAAPVVVVVDDLAHEPAFRIGALEVRPATREVIVGDRREVLEPRVMQVLVVLAYSAGEVVSRDHLFRTCWAGRIVGEDAVNRAVAGVRRVGQRLGGFKVVTVARVGYRIDVADPARPRARLGLALLESLLPLLADVAVLVSDSVHPWRRRAQPITPRPARRASHRSTR